MKRATIPCLAGMVYFVIGLALTRPALAQAPELDELIREALERSAELGMLQARVEAAEQQVSPAGALPDPMLEFMRERANFSERSMTMLGVELRQSFPFPGKRGARRKAMGAEAVAIQREFEAMQRGLVREVRTLFASLYAQDRAQQSLVAARDLVELLNATVASRYSSGEGALEEQLKTQVERARIEERLDDLAVERAATVAALNRILDRPSDSQIGRVLALPEIEAPAEPWEELALARSASIATQSAEVRAAELYLDAARRDQAPDFAAGLGFASAGGSESTVTLRVGIELPLWRHQKQKPLVGAARSQVRAAEYGLRDARAKAVADAVRLRAEWQRSQRQLLRYREAILPQTSTALDAARGAYMAGRSDFSTVIEDYRLWLEARIELAQREAQQFASWAEIQALLAPGSPQEDRR